MDQEPSTKIEGWKQYFHDRGLAASDIPKALVVHEVFSCVSHALGLYSPAAGVVSKSRKSRCGRVFKCDLSDAPRLFKQTGLGAAEM